MPRTEPARLPMRVRAWLAAAALAVAGASALAAGADGAAPALQSGRYEGLMLAVAADGRVTGRYLEEQGQGVAKRCAFTLRGQVGKDGLARVETTSGTRTLPGTIRPRDGGVELAVPHGRDHAGCGLVLMPEIDSGLELDTLQVASWKELRTVTAGRAYFFGEPASGTRRKAYLVRGDVVGVSNMRDDGWVEVEFVSGEGVRTKGWMRVDEVGGLR